MSPAQQGHQLEKSSSGFPTRPVDSVVPSSGTSLPSESKPVFISDSTGAADMGPPGGAPLAEEAKGDVTVGGDSKTAPASTGSGETEEEPSADVALPPAIFNATKHPELTDIPPDVIERLAQEFVEKVKQGGWDTTSEAYRKNWEKAVEEANEAFKAAFGYDAYLKLTSGGTN